MLTETPEIAGYNFATVVLLGDADRVRAELQCDPGLATRQDPETGWTALHAACASRLYQLKPSLADGLAAVARVLVEAGADPLAASPRWTPLGCAIAATNTGPSNRSVVELLIACGARANEEDLYLAGFATDRLKLLPLLLANREDSAGLRRTLAPPVSKNDSECVRLLLEAGADPRDYRDDNGEPVPAVWAAIKADCGASLIELLLEYGADPDVSGPDGKSPYRLALSAGRTELLEQLRRHGALEDATDTARFISACMRGDRQDTQKRLDDDPTLIERLDPDEQAALVRAADRGRTSAVALMLDLGMAIDARGDNGATALHAAAYYGSAEVVELLLRRGADIDAQDTTWHSTPLDWAIVGSGEQPMKAPKPDWPRTVSILLAHGAEACSEWLAPDEPKSPSAGVAALLRQNLESRKG